MASPPHIPSLNIPRKRNSISSLNGAPSKKRKPSHLRNAFSPDAEGVGSPLRYSRSPSVDSVATTSVINGAGGKKRKKKGDGDTASVVSSVRGGRGKGADGGSTVGGEGGDGADGGEYEDDDDEDDMGVEMDMAGEEGGMNAEERRNQEKEHERYVYDLKSSTSGHAQGQFTDHLTTVCLWNT
jgi:transcription initiation factor TFIID subunit 11